MRADEFLNEACWSGYKQVGMKKKGTKNVPNCVPVEENASGDSSLHDWFTKSKASDGTKGWVQIGGKYAGKPCAKQPGQTTKPKCGSSKMKRNLNAKEEEAAARRKRREDPNPDRRGKAKNVATKSKRKTNEGVTKNLNEFLDTNGDGGEDPKVLSLNEFADIVEQYLGKGYTRHDRKKPKQVSVKFVPKDKSRPGAILYSHVDPRRGEYDMANLIMIDYVDGMGQGRSDKFGVAKTIPNAVKMAEMIFGKHQDVEEGWSKKYKDSINCSNPKGFSQRAHCQGKKKANESHGYNIGFHGEETPRALDSISEYKLRPQAVEADQLVDVYVVGSHKGREISRQVARSISNKKIPAFTNFLVNKYNIDPSAVVYGPAAETVDEAVIATAPGQASTAPVASRYDPAQLAATKQRLAATPVAMNTGRLGTNNVGIQTSAARG